MKFSVHEVSQCADDRSPEQVINETIKLAQKADELGFERIWLAEHHFTHYGVVGSPLLLASAIAQATERIRIGMAVLVLPFYEPVRLAEEIAMLDVISGGRLDVGYGRGYQPVEFAGFRVDMAESRTRTAETVEVMKRAWVDDPFSFEGEHFQIPEISVYPRPHQRPYPPLFEAAVSIETFRRAGAAGTRILTAPNFTPAEAIAEQLDAYRDALRDAGHDPADFEYPVMQLAYLGDTEVDAREAPKRYAMWYYHSLGMLVTGAGGKSVAKGYESWAKISDRIKRVTYEEVLEHGAIFATPDRAIERLRRLRDIAGVNHFTLWPNFGGIDHRLALRTIERWASEVMPAMRDEDQLLTRT